MKKIFFATILFTMFLATTASAETVCQWDGTKVSNCKIAKSMPNGEYRIAGGLQQFEEGLNAEGWYLVDTIQPNCNPATQKAGNASFAEVDGRIFQTSTCITLLPEEINQANAAVLDRNTWLLIKWMVTEHIATPASLNKMNPELKAAYDAHEALTP